MQLLIVKRSSRREPYAREKLHAGLSRACAKTMVTAEQVDDLVDSVESELTSMGKREISASFLGELALSRLQKLNQVAYVRFASVYRQFQSIGDFIRELEALKESAPLTTKERFGPDGIKYSGANLNDS
jgi:transcriptional repressor NrdR